MNKVIEIALAEQGYSRRPATEQEINEYAEKKKISIEEAKLMRLKWNKYGDWFGFNYVAYCMIFCCWVYDKAGIPIRGDWKKGFASVPKALEHFSQSNEVTHYPQAGDLVIFDWQRDNKPDHVGLFIKDLGNGTIETIEGNTSDDNPSNGGKVERKIRDKKFVTAYIHPKVLDTLT